MAQHLKKRSGSKTLPIIAALTTAAVSVALLIFTLLSPQPDNEEPTFDEYRGRVAAPQDMDREEALEALGYLADEYGDVAWIVQHEEEIPDELLMAAANNPEKAGFVRGYMQEEREIIVATFTAKECRADCPLLLQWDVRWGYGIYGSSVIGMTGCGPTCMSMVILALTGDESATPDQLAYWAEDNGYYAPGAGTSWTYIAAQAEEYGLTAEELPLWEASMKQALDREALIVCSMGEGDFTVDGHYIVITGYDEDGFTVNDPNCIYRSGMKWSYADLEGQISNLWAVE